MKIITISVIGPPCTGKTTLLMEVWQALNNAQIKAGVVVKDDGRTDEKFRLMQGHRLDGIAEKCRRGELGIILESIDVRHDANEDDIPF